ncbi:hypothetical protein K449DRAFT_428799 [Hypoxylon sp. EC38]|nr:hypothetical protein K449DRAFT_428799 [Hypoxylon sp. EC38]
MHKWKAILRTGMSSTGLSYKTRGTCTMGPIHVLKIPPHVPGEPNMARNGSGVDWSIPPGWSWIVVDTGLTSHVDQWCHLLGPRLPWCSGIKRLRRVFPLYSLRNHSTTSDELRLEGLFMYCPPPRKRRNHPTIHRLDIVYALYIGPTALPSSDLSGPQTAFISLAATTSTFQNCIGLPQTPPLSSAAFDSHPCVRDPSRG